MPNLPNTFNPNLSMEPFRGVGQATSAGSTSMAIPQAALLALSLGSGFLDKFFGSRSRRKEEERRERLTRDLAGQDDRRVRDLANLEVSHAESKLDPFRDVLAQIAAAERADRLARTRPLTINRTGGNNHGYAVPTFEGGALSYEADPELIAAANALRTLVLGGQGQAPSVVPGVPSTNPTGPNPRSGALDLIAGRNRPPVSTTMPVSPPVPMGPPGMPVAPGMPGRPPVYGVPPNEFPMSIDALMQPPPTARRPPRQRRPMTRRY